MAAGARTVNIPDTVGYSAPRRIRRADRPHRAGAGRLRDCQRALPRRSGPGGGQLLAAVEAGARQIECTINGIGERAGNCSLEEVVMVMKTRHDRLSVLTPASTPSICISASQLLSSIITFGPQPNKAIVGRNAFAHEAGIHQDGYLKEQDHLRDHGTADGGRAGRQAGAGQAQRPARAASSAARIWDLR